MFSLGIVGGTEKGLGSNVKAEDVNLLPIMVKNRTVVWITNRFYV